MKILFLAAKIHPDKTSCGLLACKLIKVLEEDSRKEIDVLTLDPDLEYSREGGRRSVRHFNRVNFLDVTNSRRVRNGLAILLVFKRNFPWIHNKANALVAYLTGFNCYHYLEVISWGSSIRSVLNRRHYDLIFCYGSGQDFNCHLAMTSIRTTVPWVANYHDPFPGSKYPEPYRVYTRFISRKQERANRSIMKQAAFVTFPSSRLAAWQIAQSGTEPKSTVIIPHAGIHLPNLTNIEQDSGVDLDERLFILLHTGTLLTPRDPRALLRAFKSFLSRDEDRRRRSRMMFVGKVNKEHGDYPEWSELRETGCFSLFQERVSYKHSLHLSSRATVLISLEAIAKTSPFFPGKLADYISLDKPILALAPMESTIVDMLGESYPYLARPDDQDMIEEKLELLWNQWNQNPKLNLGMPSLREYIGAGSINSIVDKLVRA